MLFFGFGLFVGLLLIPGRCALADCWFWLGGVIALALFAPNLVWEHRHHWATLEALRNVQATGKNVVLSPAAFLGQQAFVLLPLTLPVWAAGLWFYGFDVHGRRYQFLARNRVCPLGAADLAGGDLLALPARPRHLATQDRGRPRRSFTAAFRRHVRLAGDGRASRARLSCVTG